MVQQISVNSYMKKNVNLSSKNENCLEWTVIWTGQLSCCGIYCCFIEKNTHGLKSLCFPLKTDQTEFLIKIFHIFSELFTAARIGKGALSRVQSNVTLKKH